MRASSAARSVLRISAGTPEWISSRSSSSRLNACSMPEVFSRALGAGAVALRHAEERAVVGLGQRGVQHDECILARRRDRRADRSRARGRRRPPPGGRRGLRWAALSSGRRAASRASISAGGNAPSRSMPARERIVGSSSLGFSASRMRVACAGGSSRILSSELAASFMNELAVKI